MIGKKITKVQRVLDLAAKKKSLWHTRWDRPAPASVLAHMPCIIIVNYIRMGWLYEYTPKRK